jgi:predicted amidohydrolase
VRNLNITLLQTELTWQDPATNRAMFSDRIANLKEESDLVVLPEMFTTGFTMDAKENSETPDGPTVKWLQHTAADQGITLCGSLIIREEQHFYNRLYWVSPNGKLKSYDKRHLFRMANESDHYTAGTERLVVELHGWRICPLVCYDLRFPVWSRGSNEFDLLLYVANWPASRRSAWDTLIPARAIENLCYAAGVNRTGTDDNGVEYDGGSLIADYLGRLKQAGADPTVLHKSLDGKKLLRYREKFPAWKDADEFEIKGLPRQGRT